MLKDTDSYKEGRIEEALKSTFMEIDKKLRDPFVIKVNETLLIEMKVSLVSVLFSKGTAVPVLGTVLFDNST